ncbi:MAG: IMS domain-containing protein [Calothrix sp. MO_192.B10]|nr:IMS domain-containing protein [Calothrix sp. MO_192.B10]
MQIPLDYYRILGLPLAASDEQLRQAYNDRMVQLPRREYSQAAIGSRKQLIEKAYAILSDPKERKAYEQLYLAHTYDPDDRMKSSSVAVEERPSQENINLDAHKLGVEIDSEQLVGALLILQELGEYELVLKMGHPYLVNNKNTSTAREPWDLPSEFPDIVLTVALACLELGREQWQQGNYENAAISLETGEELLIEKKLFPNVQAEIKSDLYRLRPYRILELLQLPLEKASERRQGLQLLQKILEERGGIDGTGDDRSGLNIDDFLRFIQQLRNYLTVAEQHKLFETESKRPSAVATYLTIYSLIARGFTQRQPALIRRSKQMLMDLGKRQDIHLEQSLCSLLLGQTEEASRVLELSQEYEALVFIREKSEDSPDLLPGLCLYTERWLETEVFPHFRDLAKQPASLKEYFADQQVQAYLEALPTEEVKAAGKSPKSPHRSFTSTRKNTSNYPQSDRQNIQPPTVASSDRSQQQTITPGHPVSPSHQVNDNSFSPNRDLELEESQYFHSSPPPTQPRKRQSSSAEGSVNIGDRRYVTRRRRRTTSRSRNTRIRLMWTILTSVAGLIVLWFLVSTIFGWLRNLVNPVPSLQGSQVAVEINQPPIQIPKPGSKNQLPISEFTEITARQVIQSWLSTKSLALGSNHDIGSLENILVGSALSKWQAIAQQNKKNNSYRQYEHQITDVKIDRSADDQNQVAVEASVIEVANYYDNGQMNQKRSYNETLRVRYDLIKKDGKWLIQSMSVVNKIS